jgi:hypothetical protein
MARRYKVRLGDGTLLGVDLAGLQAWLIDDRARVQPVGSRHWRPLKEVLAEEMAVAANREARANAAPPSARARPEEVVAKPPEPTAPPPEPVAMEPAPVPEPVPEFVPEPVAEPAESEARPGANMAILPDEEPTSPEFASPEEELALPSEPMNLDDVETIDLGEVARSASVAPAPPPIAEPPRHRTARREQEPPDVRTAPLDLGEVARSAVGVAPIAESAWTRKTAPDDDRGVIRLKPLDDDELPEAALPELDLVEEAAPVKSPPPLAQTILDTASRLAAQVTPERQDRFIALIRPWVKPAAAIAGLVLAALLVAATWPVWGPRLGSLFASREKPAAPAPASTPAPEVTATPVPEELRIATEELPHLSPETIRLVSSSIDLATPTPPEIFRRAHTAANRGASALTEGETRELRSLRNAVVGALQPIDRERVRAYDRLTVGQGLLVAEDARVLRLYARGVRSLGSERRERLQALLGKAIAAALVRSPPPRAASR